MKLTVVFEDGDRVVAKSADNQLYLGVREAPDAPRTFNPIDSYELRYDAEGNVELKDSVDMLAAP